MVDRALPKQGPTFSANQLPGFNSGQSIVGEAVYTIPGTYQWVVPEGVLSVSCVAMGGGATGLSSTSNTNTIGGAGGANAWKNNISVSPGESIEVIVGEAGNGAIANAGSVDVFAENSGGFSQFKDASTCKAGGGTISPLGNITANTPTSIGGVFLAGDGGGDGGDGQTDFVNITANCSGAGAAGYSDDGGDGVTTVGLSTSNGNAGLGGGSGSGGIGNSNDIGGGGGTGLYGEGDSGAGGVGDASAGNGGVGGSGGQDGFTYDVAGAGNGGIYGGGGAAGETDSARAPAGHGAVRIIWGEDRAFPSQNTGRL